jgi:hypothetical protein
MTNKIKYIILSFFIALSCYAQDQEAVLYFKDGDSVKGYGMLKRNKIKFKLALEDKLESWDFESVSKIRFYGFNMSRTFKYVKLNKYEDPEILEVIVEEEVALFRDSYTEWHGSVNGNGNGFGFGLSKANKIGHHSQVVKDYLKRTDDEYPTCVNCDAFNKWKKNTIAFFADCPTLVQKIQNNTFREKHLQEIVEYYIDYCYEE